MKFKEGVIVRIATSDALAWDGLRAKVVRYTEWRNSSGEADVWLDPLEDRPDGCKQMRFVWPVRDLIPVEDEMNLEEV